MIITLADEYDLWAIAQIRRAFITLKGKRKRTLAKLLVVSDQATAVMFTKVLSNAKAVLAKREHKYAPARDYAVVIRKEGAVWCLYLDNTKPAIRRTQRERRRK